MCIVAHPYNQADGGIMSLWNGFKYLSEEDVHAVLNALTAPGGGNEVASTNGKLTDEFMSEKLPFLEAYRETHDASRRLEGDRDRHESRERALWLSHPQVLLNNQAMVDRKAAEIARLTQAKVDKAAALAEKPRLDAELAAAKQAKLDQKAAETVEKGEKKKANEARKVAKQQEMQDVKEANAAEKLRKSKAKDAKKEATLENKRIADAEKELMEQPKVAIRGTQKGKREGTQLSQNTAQPIAASSRPSQAMNARAKRAAADYVCSDTFCRKPLMGISTKSCQHCGTYEVCDDLFCLECLVRHEKQCESLV